MLARSQGLAPQSYIMPQTAAAAAVATAAPPTAAQEQQTAFWDPQAPPWSPKSIEAVEFPPQALPGLPASLNRDSAMLADTAEDAGTVRQQPTAPPGPVAPPASARMTPNAPERLCHGVSCEGAGPSATGAGPLPLASETVLPTIDLHSVAIDTTLLPQGYVPAGTQQALQHQAAMRSLSTDGVNPQALAAPSPSSPSHSEQAEPSGEGDAPQEPQAESGLTAPAPQSTPLPAVPKQPGVCQLECGAGASPHSTGAGLPHTAPPTIAPCPPHATLSHPPGLLSEGAAPAGTPPADSVQAQPPVSPLENLRVSPGDTLMADATAVTPDATPPTEEPPQHVATPNVSPVQPDNLKARHVPFKARAALGDYVALTLTRAQDAVSRLPNSSHQDAVAREFDSLLRLPGRVLSGPGSNGHRAVRKRLLHLQTGQPGADSESQLGFLRQEQKRYTSEALASRRSRLDAQAEQKMKAAAQLRHGKPLAENPPLQEQLGGQISAQLQRNSVQRAAKVLTSADLAHAGSMDIECALRERHPAGPGEATVVPVLEDPKPPPASIDAVTFREVVRGLPAGTSSGPSGWTFEMIKEILLMHEDAFRSSLWFVNRVLAGELPVLPNLTACRLIALYKGDIRNYLFGQSTPNVRPIAIPEAWMRLISLCALATEQGIGRTLLPHQFAVSISGGAQILGHALRLGSQDPEAVTISLDIENAFNSVSRNAILEGIAKRAPGLLPFAAYTYATSSTLYISGGWEGSEPIASTEGVRQGDPCAPLFFALCIQDDLQAANEAGNGEAPPLAYADDISVQGAPEAALAVTKTLLARLQARRLQINPLKCKVYSRTRHLAEGVAQQLGLGPAAVVSDGLVIAGTPVGTDQYAQAHVHRRVTDTQEIIHNLLLCDVTPQARFLILQQCLQNRDTHLMRCIPWGQLAEDMNRLSNTIVSAAKQIIGIGDAEFLHSHRQQLQLPLRHGGFGLVEFDERRADAAFLSAAALAQQALSTAPPRMQPFGDGAAHLWPRYERLVAEYPEVCADPHASAEQLVDTSLPQLQRTVNRARAQQSFDELLQVHTAKAETAELPSAKELAQMDCARLRSYACREATCWLTQVPHSNRLTLQKHEWQVGARAQLGLCFLPSYDTVDGLVTCFCSRTTAGTPCGHAQSCTLLQKVMASRHSNFLHQWREICRMAGHATTWEPHTADYLLAPLDTQAQAPDPTLPAPMDNQAPAPAPSPAGPLAEDADMLPPSSPPSAPPASSETLIATPARPSPHTRAPSTATRGDFTASRPGRPPVMGDVGITSPYRQGVLHLAATRTGYAAEQYADSKHRKYRKVGASYCDHVPIIHENSGRLNKDGWKFLKMLATDAATEQATTKAEFLSTSLGLLGITTIRAIYVAIRAYTPIHHRLAGGALVPGLVTPTNDLAAMDS